METKFINNKCLHMNSFRSKVDKFVLRTPHVNLRIVSGRALCQVAPQGEPRADVHPGIIRIFNSCNFMFGSSLR